MKGSRTLRHCIASTQFKSHWKSFFFKTPVGVSSFLLPSFLIFVPPSKFPTSPKKSENKMCQTKNTSYHRSRDCSNPNIFESLSCIIYHRTWALQILEDLEPLGFYDKPCVSATFPPLVRLAVVGTPRSSQQVGLETELHVVGWDDSGRFAFLVCLCLWICGCIMDKLMHDIYFCWGWQSIL